MPDQLLFLSSGNAWLNSPTTHTFVAVVAILLALAFDFVNGFHDTANACATVIYTKALKPTTAIVLSGLFNFLGALLVGTAVAQVITKIIPASAVTLSIVVAVLLAALIWNLLTWWFGIPASSSHCLIGSLFGAGIMAAGVNGVAWHELNKVFAALIFSPIAGFAAGGALTWLGIKLSKRGINQKLFDEDDKPSWIGRSPRPASNTISATLSAPNPTNTISDHQPKLMRWLHILSSILVSFSHGSNDGQKTMGVITLILATHFAGQGYTFNHVHPWVMFACATAIGLGTMIGGWRIIRTVGERISKEPITHAQGFGASMATALVILSASGFGAPISTTHTLSSAVAGGTIPSYGIRKLNGNTVQTIALAWVLTVPVTAALSAICFWLIKAVIP